MVWWVDKELTRQGPPGITIRCWCRWSGTASCHGALDFGPWVAPAPPPPARGRPHPPRAAPSTPRPHPAQESEGEDAETSRVTLAQDLGRGNVAARQSRVRLHEIGPRLDLELVKVGQGAGGKGGCRGPGGGL